MATAKQALPKKEHGEFQALVKCYEDRSYKKGIKIADGILKAYPDHAETTSMKALILSSMDRRPEGVELAKRALKLNLQSHLCWHVLGLIHRSDRSYSESVKCFKTALRFCVDQVSQAQILRDLCFVQLFTRDMPGFLDSRRKLLNARANLSVNWLGCALAEHLNGNYQTALDMLDSCEEAFAAEFTERTDKSELASYKVQLLLESGKYAECLAKLEASRSVISDRIFLLETTAVLHHLLATVGSVESSAPSIFDASAFDYHMTQAIDAVSKLIKLLPDNDSYARAYIYCLMLQKTPSYQVPNIYPSPTGYESLGKPVRVSVLHSILSGPECVYWGNVEKRKIFNGRKIKGKFAPLISEPGNSNVLEAIHQLPHSEVQTRLLILYTDSTHMKVPLQKYLKEKLKRCVPNMFALMREFYALRCTADRSDAQKVLEVFAEVYEALLKEECTEHVKALLLFLVSNHEFVCGRMDTAIKRIDEAIEADKSLTDLLLWKSKMLSKIRSAQSMTEAVKLAEQAAEGDQSDRCVNTLYVKCLLKSGDLEKATKTVLKFSKESNDSKEPNLVDMQAEWWENGVGKCNWNAGNHYQAIISFQQTLQHFEDIREDEFDFQLYCLRKTTLRALVDYLKLQGTMKSGNSKYKRALKNITKAWIHLAKQNQPDASVTTDTAHVANITNVSLNSNEYVYTKFNNSVEALKGMTPMTEAQKYADLYEKLFGESASAHKLSFEVALLSRNFQVCLRELRMLKSSDESTASLFAKRVFDALEKSANPEIMKELADIVELTKAIEVYNKTSESDRLKHLGI